MKRGLWTDEEIDEILRQVREENERAIAELRSEVDRKTRVARFREAFLLLWLIATWLPRQVALNWQYATGVELGMMVSFGIFVGFLAFVLLGSR